MFGYSVLPRDKLIAVIHGIEEHFRLNFVHLITLSNIAQKLFDGIFPRLNFQFLFLDHAEHDVYLSHKITKLYIVMRIFYALKFMNRDIAAMKCNTQKVGVRKSTNLRKNGQVFKQMTFSFQFGRHTELYILNY